jgi:predicted PurR-regulated permease PerM
MILPDTLGEDEVAASLGADVPVALGEDVVPAAPDERVAAAPGTGNGPVRGRESRKVTPVKILVAGAMGLLLYFAHVAFVPIALALLLALVLSGPVEALHCWRIPRSVSAAVLLIVIVGILAALVDFISVPAQQWFAAAPHTLRTIERKIRPVEKVIDKVDDLRNSAGSIGSATHAPTPPSAAASDENGTVTLLDETRGVVLSSVTVIILTLFLLAGGPPMLARMTSAFASDLNSAHIIGVIEKVRREVGRFYVTMALINVGLGFATAFTMMWCGMPNPFLWGTLAGVLNFIPYLGATTTLIVLTLVAIVSFDGLSHVIAVAGSYLALAAIEGQFVQPLLVGRRLKLNPMLVFLALWFGGLFWGVAGIILATPTLVALKVVAENSSGGGPVLNFLSPHKQD